MLVHRGTLRKSKLATEGQATDIKHLTARGLVPAPNDDIQLSAVGSTFSFTLVNCEPASRLPSHIESNT